MRVRQGNSSSVVRYTVIALLITTALPSFADANSWLKPTSGNWEEPYWSQGILPNSGHAVMITNAGWKAVQIAPSTVQNFPDSLNVYSITVASPVDSFNTLLLNYAGLDRPLTVNYSLHVGPGAALTMFNSALRIATPTGVGLSVGGELNQNDYSQVTGNHVDVGYIGPGVYNFNSGLVQLQHLWVISNNNAGVFNQNGGSNSSVILHLEPGGRYNLRDGDFRGSTYTSAGTVFRQDGGRVHSLLEFHGGQYILNNGINYGGVTVPVYGNYRNGNASAIQNGGTNLGPILIGALSGAGTGSGSYTLSNGVISSPVIALSMFGSFRQDGGTVTTPGAITLSWGYYHRGEAAGSGYLLNAGSLSSTGISLDLSGFQQDGGTNAIAGDLVIYSTYYGSTSYSLNGGLLLTENVYLRESTTGGFFQSGGTHRVANTLSVSSNRYLYAWKGYVMSGGQLIVSNISLTSGGPFTQTGGTVTQSGNLTLDTGHLSVGPGTQQFGAMQLVSTNHLTMPSASAITRFHDSSALPWGADSSLIIDNYSGSYLGGGSQRIIFGNSGSALTPQQVAKISFRNPANLPYGTHPAKILSSGEVVPDSFPPVGRIPPRLTLRTLPDSTVEITLTTEPGYDYGVLTSTDLATWNFWTNRVATTNTLTFVDPHNIQWWPFHRFYKAVFMR